MSEEISDWEVEQWTLHGVLPVLDFGDYARIEMKRHGCANQIYLHKVIRKQKSNSYVDVPVQSPATETRHDEIAEVYACICCGIDETEVLKYKSTDVMSNLLYLEIDSEKQETNLTHKKEQ